MNDPAPDPSAAARIVAASPDAIITLDHAGRILGFNPAAERIFEQTADSLLGQHASACLLSAADRPSLQSELERATPTREPSDLPFRREARAIRSTGTEFPCELAVAPLAGPGRARYCLFLRDITDRSKIEETLRQTRERLERAQRLGRMGDAERVVGEPHHRVWSREMLSLHGFSPDEPTPSRDALLARVHPGDRPAMLAAIQSADTGEDIPTFDFRIVLPTGETRWLRVHTEITRDRSHGRLRVASSTLDVTEQKAVELEMLRTLERERELGRLKADFLHMVTHEYRTPLGIIVSAAQILERYHERLNPDERAAQLADIRDSARRLADLMEEVLFLGKTAAGTVPLDVQTFDCATLLREVVREVRTTYGPQREVRLEAARLPPTAQADPKLLRHILINLLSNALKYSFAPQPVTLSARLEDDWLVFVVGDEGIGIPESDQPRMFEMFRRGSNVGAISGTGLGLVVVKRCVDLHGGTFSLHSQEKRGTEITVRLPCRPPPSPSASPLDP